jgi:hypothetical protein
MQESTRHDKKIMAVTISVVIWVFALSLINTATSKKPDNSVKGFSNNGVISGGTGIEVYWDSKCINKVSSIDWGSLEPGTTTTVTLFIKNKGKNQVTLGYYTSNWSPSEIANCLNLKWDYTGQNIEFKETVQVVFILHVSENVEATETFSFDIVIVATQ